MSQPDVDSNVTVVDPPRADTVKHSAPRARLSVRSFGLTDRGKVREGNEDQFLIACLSKTLRVQTSLPQPDVVKGEDQSHLFAVADGMGGHAGGEQASALALGQVERFVRDTFKWFAGASGEVKGQEQDQVLADFRTALAQANARVLAEAAERPELHGMGTTLTLAYSLNDVLFVAHVGDSRCYLFRNAFLYRLTHDHTMVEEMVKRGVLSPAEAVGHQWRHVITNVVGGTTPDVKVELHKVHLEPDDVVLLCSDGLTEMLPDTEIARTLQAESDPERACRALVDQANAAGGRDNVTVVVARFDPA